MARKKPTIGIIGLGSVGSILAAHLARSGEDVVVEDILENLLVKVKKDGLNIAGITKLKVRIDKTANSIPELSRFNPEIIFIATKACFLQEILREIKKIYKPNMKIVSFQNGLDNEQIIAETIGIDTTYRAVVNYAGDTISPGNVKMSWFQPPNYIGAFHKGKYTTDKTTRYIAHAMTTSALETKETPEIKKHVWEKTIINVLCSICAITGQTMKEAMEYKPTRNIAEKLIAEGLKVAEADGYNFGADALSRFTSYLEKGGAHKPSMLVDVESKKATEVDFLTGAIARYGEKYKIQTPIHSTFTGLLKALENQYLSAKPR